MKINKKKIGKILDEMGKALKDSKEVVTEDGHSVDFKKFNSHPIVIQAIQNLKLEGVKDNKHLSQLGFIPAGMLMRF